jgi:hypothetical protein
MSESDSRLNVGETKVEDLSVQYKSCAELEASFNIEFCNNVRHEHCRLVTSSTDSVEALYL